jgi:hypothetical protein
MEKPRPVPLAWELAERSLPATRHRNLPETHECCTLKGAVAMKKQIHKKLMLSKDTLRSLAERELESAVRGGGTAFFCDPSEATMTCGGQCTVRGC